MSPISLGNSQLTSLYTHTSWLILPRGCNSKHHLRCLPSSRYIMEVMVRIGGRKEQKRKGNKLFQSFHSQKNFSISFSLAVIIFITQTYLQLQFLLLAIILSVNIMTTHQCPKVEFFRFLWTPALKVQTGSSGLECIIITCCCSGEKYTWAFLCTPDRREAGFTEK